jgi:hypothetical protein
LNQLQQNVLQHHISQKKLSSIDVYLTDTEQSSITPFHVRFTQLITDAEQQSAEVVGDDTQRHGNCTAWHNTS